MFGKVDLNQVVNFTVTDKAVLESAGPIVEALGDLLGPTCEVVLHSLEDLDHSIVKIANGHVTGRGEGAPITDLALHMLHQMRAKGAHFSQSYFTRSKNGELMKCTSIAIRNTDGKIVALMCININLDAPFSSIIKNFTPGPAGEIRSDEGMLLESPEEQMEKNIRDTIYEVNKDPSIPSKQKNRQIVYRLYDTGTFNFKESVAMVAQRLSVSRHTIYLYIRERRHNAVAELDGMGSMNNDNT